MCAPRLLSRSLCSSKGKTPQLAPNVRRRKGCTRSLDMVRLPQAAQHNGGRRDIQFGVGNVVLRSTHRLSDADRGFAASLADKWQGPYRVSAKVRRLSYKLAYCEKGDECGLVNVNDLKRFFDHPEDSDALQAPVPVNPGSRPRNPSSPVYRHNLGPRLRHILVIAT